MTKRYSQKIRIYLFDWGDTLMVDFSQYAGPMCDWPHVTTVDGAHETLAHLSSKYPVYVATGAANSSEQEIKAAFERAGLAPFISGYFCQSNIGIGKESSEFYVRIIDTLGVEPHCVTMIGDSIIKDVTPALNAGLNAILLSKALASAPETSDLSYRVINHLNELMF